jgi:hypothetical protein
MLRARFSICRRALSMGIDVVNARLQLSRCCRLVPACHAGPQHVHGFNSAGEWSGTLVADLRIVSVACGGEIRPNIGSSNQAEGLLLVRSVRVRLGAANRYCDRACACGRALRAIVDGHFLENGKLSD